MIAVKHTKGKAAKAAPLAAAIAALDKVERELARTQNRWQKARALVKRLEAKADQEWCRKLARDSAHFAAAPFNDDL